MQQEDKTLSQENIDAVLKYLDMSPRDALKVEAAKIIRGILKICGNNLVVNESKLKAERMDSAGELPDSGVLFRSPASQPPSAAQAEDIRALKTAAPSKGGKQNG